MVEPLDPRAARSETEIARPVERVWRALTTAADLERWFAGEAAVEPGEVGWLRFSWGGDRAHLWRIERWDPPRHMRLVDAAVPGRPELVTDLRLRGGEQRTHIRVETSQFPEEDEWDDLIRSTRLAYRFLLLQLRHYLEHHDGEDREIVCLRQRLALPREEIWARVEDSDALGMSAERVLDCDEQWQLSVITRSPPRGLCRIAVDSVPGEPEQHDLSLWLSFWGDQDDGIECGARSCREALETLFPGVDPMNQTIGGAPSALAPPDAFLAYNLNGRAPGEHSRGA